MPIRYISKGKGKKRRVIPIRPMKGVSVRSVSLQPTVIGKINKEQISLLNRGESATFSKALNKIVIRAKKDPDLVNQIIAYEEGGLNDQNTLELFARLIKSGMVWKLQGHYGRMATDLINKEIISKDGKILKSAEQIRMESGYD